MQNGSIPYLPKYFFKTENFFSLFSIPCSLKALSFWFSSKLGCSRSICSDRPYFSYFCSTHSRPFRSGVFDGSLGVKNSPYRAFGGCIMWLCWQFNGYDRSSESVCACFKLLWMYQYRIKCHFNSSIWDSRSGDFNNLYFGYLEFLYVDFSHQIY